MKVALNGSGVLAVAAVAAVALGLIVLVPRLRRAAAVVAEKINPASRENIAYQATGEFGTYLPDLFGGLFKSDAEKKVDAMLRSPTTPTVKRTITPVQPIVTSNGTLIRGADRDLIR